MTEPNPADKSGGKAAKVVKRSIVTYRHPDPLTGRVLEGAGLAIVVPDEGAITIAPFSPELLEVDPENVWVAEGTQG